MPKKPCTIKTSIHYEVRVTIKDSTTSRCFLFLETALESFKYQLNILAVNLENHTDLSLKLLRVDPAHPDSCCYTLYSFEFAQMRAHPAILPAMSVTCD